MLFERVLELKEKGELPEALNLLLKNQFDELSIEWFEQQMLIGEIYRLQGEYEEALEFLHSLKTRIKDLAEDLLILKKWIMVEEKYVLWRKFHLEWDYKGFIELEKDYVALNSISDYFQLKSNHEIIADYYHLLGLVHYSRGKYHASIGYYENSLKYRTKRTTLYANTVMNIGINYLHLLQTKKSLEYYEEALQILENVGNITTLAHLYNNTGVANSKLGRYNEALKYFEKSLEIDKKIGVIPKIANVYQNIGIAYSGQGNYNKALEFHHLSLDLKRKFGSTEDISDSIHWIGQCLILKGELLKAKNLLEECLLMKQAIGNDSITATILVDLIKLHYILPDENKPSYLEELKHIANTSLNPSDKMLYLLCEGLDYKEKPNFSKMVQAQKNFSLILDSSDSDFDLKYNSLLHLTELKLLEYKLFNSEDILQALKKNMDSFYELSDKSDSVIIHLEALLLDISINNVEGKFNIVLEKINQGIEIAENNTLFYHVQIFQNLKSRVTEKLENYRSIVQDSKNILQQLDESSFDSYLDHVLQANWSKS